MGIVHSADSFEDLVGVVGPYKGLWMGVVLFDVSVDCGLELDDGMEYGVN